MGRSKFLAKLLIRLTFTERFSFFFSSIFLLGFYSSAFSYIFFYFGFFFYFPFIFCILIFKFKNIFQFCKIFWNSWTFLNYAPIFLFHEQWLIKGLFFEILENFGKCGNNFFNFLIIFWNLRTFSDFQEHFINEKKEPQCSRFKKKGNRDSFFSFQRSCHLYYLFWGISSGLPTY